MKDTVLNCSNTANSEIHKLNEVYKFNNRIFIDAIVATTLIYVILSVLIV